MTVATNGDPTQVTYQSNKLRFVDTGASCNRPGPGSGLPCRDQGQRRLRRTLLLAGAVLLALSAQVTITPASAAVIDFDTLGFPPYSNATPFFFPYTENGFTLATPTGQGQFLVGQSYGNPIPDLFAGPLYGTDAASLFLTRAGGGTFSLDAFDLSANNGTTLYTLAGTLGAETVFSDSGSRSVGGFGTITPGTDGLIVDAVTLTFASNSAGSSFNVDNIVAASATDAVPEPASLALLGSGLFALGVTVLRRRRLASISTVLDGLVAAAVARSQNLRRSSGARGRGQTRARRGACWGGALFLLLGWLALPPSALAAEPAQDYRARTVYFLVTDRFNPHSPYQPYVDPEYPDATNTVNCFIVACTSEVQFRSYWGGDLRGVIEKLGYLQRLGVSAVWLTPLMENVRDYEGGTGYGTAYHGYWVQNYNRVNAHFGGWSDVTALSAALHAGGMRYMQDITLNHSNPYDTHAFGRLYSGENESILVDSYNNDYDPATGQRFYKHYQDTKPCIDTQYLGSAEWSDWQLHHCLLADLSGYNQEDPTVANYLILAGRQWLEAGVDDFRLDAVKYPYPEFIASFTQAMADRAEMLGRADLYIVGEWSNGGIDDEQSLTFANSYDVYRTNIFDFDFSLRLNQFVGGDAEYDGSDPNMPTPQRISAQDLDAFLQARVSAFQGRDTWQGTFIDNHDQMRTLVRLQKLGFDAQSRERRLDLATVLLMTSRGVPFIFYGDEQYLAYYEDGHNTPLPFMNSDNDDPWNRVGMMAWDEGTPAFRIISALATLRENSPAIQRGDYVPVYADADVLVFERRLNEEVVLVAVNRGQGARVAIPAAAAFPPGQYRGVLADTSDVNAGSELVVTQTGATLTLAPLGALVVRAPNAVP